MKFLIKYYNLQTLMLIIMAEEIATAYNENALIKLLHVLPFQGQMTVFQLLCGFLVSP